MQYWPTETSGEERYGDVIVTFDSEIERNGYTKTTLYISYKVSLCNMSYCHSVAAAGQDFKKIRN